jgi:uncharacterized protein (TIGR02246 family)
MRRPLLCLLLAVLPALAAGPDEQIRTLLSKQAECWNRGDIDGFMTAYLDSPRITFSGANGVSRGYAAVLERYKQRYPTREAMGTLRFDIEEVRFLRPDVALVLGRFHLTRDAKAGGDASGRFTLVFEKTRNGWKIVHDHTS